MQGFKLIELFAKKPLTPNPMKYTLIDIFGNELELEGSQQEMSDSERYLIDKYFSKELVLLSISALDDPEEEDLTRDEMISRQEDFKRGTSPTLKYFKHFTALHVVLFWVELPPTSKLGKLITSRWRNYASAFQWCCWIELESH